MTALQITLIAAIVVPALAVLLVTVLARISLRRWHESELPQER